LARPEVERGRGLTPETAYYKDGRANKIVKISTESILRTVYDLCAMKSIPWVDYY